MQSLQLMTNGNTCAVGFIMEIGLSYGQASPDNISSAPIIIEAENTESLMQAIEEFLESYEMANILHYELFDPRIGLRTVMVWKDGYWEEE